ncbi:hypothetical protein EMEDMD4_800001 [Sinorhizobium medicae]|uniref:Uncharacterized protein n=1 Tax=Sinorhizobium medicae TaxID=110321 RepID=A0A508X6W3_9HYPH|nr:hypothetical protein EMEDMD4_800001 [Sinorhizobium medicae]
MELAPTSAIEQTPEQFEWSRVGRLRVIFRDSAVHDFETSRDGSRPLPPPVLVCIRS